MHIIFLNPQGNFDKNDTYWRDHPDFGDQLVYVKEVAIEMAKLGHSVDIVTRYINDDAFSALKGELDSYSNIETVRIVRIKCGGDKFIEKEMLWDYLDEWVDNIISFYKNEGKSIDFASGHNAEGGLACAILKEKEWIPYSYTGHKFGAEVLEELDASEDNFKELDKNNWLTKRILAERTAIANSNMIIYSSTEELEKTYNHPLYKVYSEHARFVYAPPGVNTNVFEPYNGINVSPRIKNYTKDILKRDLDPSRIELPLILNTSPLKKVNNHIGLLRAYAFDKELQERANLLLTLRHIENPFKDYSDISNEKIELLDQIMLFIKENNLLGKVSFINIKTQTQLAELYRYITIHRGIHVVTALYESFGYTTIEAMSTGLPVVSTKYGVTNSILNKQDQEYGVLVNIYDMNDIAKGIHEALSEHEFYSNVARMRVMNQYTWKITAKSYLKAIEKPKANFDIIPIPDYFHTHKSKDLPKNLIEERYLSIK